MDTIEDINSTTIYELPPEVIGIILKYVVTYKDRKNSRSVCEVWRDLINRDSSSEKYVISKKKMINDNECEFPKFSHVVSEFLGYQRRKISLEFNSVDLDETNDYWIEKGKHIIGLKFERCINIPIEEMCQHCNNIKKIEIVVYHKMHREGRIIGLTKRTAEKGIINTSVQILNIQFFDVQKERIFDFIQQINIIFPCLKELCLTARNLYEFGDLDTISQTFAHYKFKIILKNWKIDNEGNEEHLEVAFNSFPDRPISLLKLYIDAAEYQDEEQLLNSIHKYYCKDLHSLAVDCQSNVSLMKFQQFLLNSSLEMLRINAMGIFDIGEFFKNQPQEFILQYLEPWFITLIQIQKNTVNSYLYVKSLQIDTISFVAFAEIINRLTTLEFFQCGYMLDNDDVFEISHKEVVRNDNLQFLDIPISFFLQTTFAEWTYLLPNLKVLKLFDDLDYNDTHELRWEKLIRNIDHKDFKCMNCPQLSELFIDLVELFNYDKPEVHIEWIKNILYLFPNITSLIFNYPPQEETSDIDYLPISDEELSGILKSCPKLQCINCFDDVQMRIERLRSRI